MKNNVFYDNFIRLCNRENKPPSIVADELGLSRAAVSKWKDGAVPYRSTILKIADYFHVIPDSLLAETVEQANQAERRTDTESELEEYLEELRNRSEVRMLLSVTKDATKADVERAVAIIEALRKSEGK